MEQVRFSEFLTLPPRPALRDTWTQATELISSQCMKVFSRLVFLLSFFGNRQHSINALGHGNGGTAARCEAPYMGWAEGTLLRPSSQSLPSDFRRKRHFASRLSLQYGQNFPLARSYLKFLPGSLLHALVCILTGLLSIH